MYTICTPMYTRYTCINTIYTPNTPLNTPYTPHIHALTHPIYTTTWCVHRYVTKPCGPASCPIMASGGLPANPFLAKIVDGKCECIAPQVCS